ncbi:MAG: histidine kinase [Microcella sp.]|uniref:sensor histidine kinase n=1 Tax=Microcella sp. TaxID=1913979 RepID=UPI0024C632F4|nr:ATP-binding protein [Microcella sp.]UYN82616.1 MAG: histidine kinase [Microcella sp.]
MSRPSPVATAVSATKAPRSPISRKRVDTVISRSVAWFGIVFGLQAVPLLLGQYELGQPLWSAITVGAVFGSLVVALFCSSIKRWVRGSHLLVSFVYVAALLTWPFFLADPAVTQVGNHWLYQLTTVATATAAIGFTVRRALIYLIVVPLIYGVIRVTPAGGGAPWELGLFDAVYAIILGGAVLVIVTMTRVAASSVDEAQGAAIDRYARAVRQHATEVERVHVDSIVHDSVLTTLLTAARAESPEQKALSAQMATNAMQHLREAALVSPDDGTTVRLRQLADRIVGTARELQAVFAIRVRSLDTRVIPSAQAEALYSAAVQAMVNSVQHAGGPEVRRWLKVSGVHGGAIEIEVGDNGRGFELDQIPDARLGVRRSIIERTASAGGHATIESSVGKGAVVTLVWPHFSPEGDRADLEGEGDA